MTAAQAAQDLVGTRFRMHGRTPETGLDCVGLLLICGQRAGRVMPAVCGYSLKMHCVDGLMHLPALAGLVATDGPYAPGDILLMQEGPSQFHFGIAGPDGGMIHAHAGLRRVVHGPLPERAPIKRWRFHDIE